MERQGRSECNGHEGKKSARGVEQDKTQQTAVRDADRIVLKNRSMTIGEEAIDNDTTISTMDRTWGMSTSLWVSAFRGSIQCH